MNNHLKFIIDESYDSRMVWQMLQAGDPAGFDSRALSMGFEPKEIKPFINKPWPKAKAVIKEIVKSKYKFLKGELGQTQKWYQESWNEINDQFFKFVSQKTKHAWEFKEYECVVSAFHPGISNWHGNVIARIWAENPFTMRKITAHELIVAHIFSILHHEQKFKNRLSNQQIWPIAEITAWCLTGLEPALIKMWPWIPKHKLFTTKHNYPQLVPLQIKLGKIYQKSKSFDDYLEKAIKLVVNIK
jgi:hypothetical protein